MLGAKEGEQFEKESQHGYLCTENIVQAARVNQFNQVVIAQGRIRVIETARSDSNSNIAAFRPWLIEAMRGMPTGMTKRQILGRLKEMWVNDSNRPVLKKHKGHEVLVWNYFKTRQLDMMTLYHEATAVTMREGPGGSASGLGGVASGNGLSEDETSSDGPGGGPT
jgi:hypothetical protein